MVSKEFYRTYWADDTISDLSNKLIREIVSLKPQHALEFGSGTGKHLSELIDLNVNAVGIDVSAINCVTSISRKLNIGTIHGDENNLRHLCNFDVVFTCSVLDHIEDIEGIIEEFKRIANKAIFLAETVDVVGPYYYSHCYEQFGFDKINFKWRSKDDGAVYYIWKLIK